MNKIIFILFLILFTGFSYAQEMEEKRDLKVGLVLSGGGAKGFAHIGVLKVLEEAGVRIDYIGGTSMGAIIGALYATGYSAHEIDSIFKNVNFDVIFQDNIPRKSKPFYEKVNGEKYALSLPMKDNKIGIPKAISRGQNVLNLITNLTQHVHGVTDFNELPIPFFCVATDLVTGKQVILDSGFLPEAVKASSAFPTLLEPVEIDGKLLIDGGVVNNFPVDEVKEMGADVLIGVDVQSNLQPYENLNSALKIINQIISFQMYKKDDEKIERTDLYMHPEVSKFNVVSFDKREEIVEKGVESARLKMNEFKQLAERQVFIKREPVVKNRIGKIHIKKIRILGSMNYTRAYIMGKLKLRRKEKISFNKLINGINNLTGTGNFENIQYKIIEEDDGNILIVKVKENDIPTTLQLGAHYDDLYKTGILVNLTTKHLLLKNDVLSADLVLGDNIRYNFDYFIDNGNYFSVGVKSGFNSFNTNLKFEDLEVNKINLEYEELSNQIYVQTIFSRKFSIGAGLEHMRIKAFTETLTSSNNEDRTFFDKSDYLNFISYLKIDTYDKKMFPKNGAFLNADHRWYLASSSYFDDFESFSQLTGKFGLAYTFWDRLTGHFISEAGFMIGNNENRALQYNVGGYGENFVHNLIPFYGYDYAELSDNSFLKSEITLRYEVFTKNYLSFIANYVRVEADLFNKGAIFDDTKSGYAIGYGLETLLGPVQIHYTWSPDHQQNYWYFNLGFWF